MSRSKHSLIIEGVKYPSVASVAMAFNINVMTLWKRIHRGLRGKKLVMPPDHRYLPYPKPVTCNKVQYPSQSAAACALDLNFQTVSERIKRGIRLDAPIRTGAPRTKRRTKPRGCK